MNKIFALLVLEVFRVMTLAFEKPSASSRTALFECADISVTIRTASGDRLAEAFTATNGVSDPKLMQWVSLGVPRLLAKTHSNSSKDRTSLFPFDFVAGGFYIYVETLGAEVANELAKRASLKYKSLIEPSQFLPINKHLWNFGCSFKIFENQRFVTYSGSAIDLSNPVSIFFETGNAAATTHTERALRQEEHPIVIQCTVESYRQPAAARAKEAETQAGTEPAFVEKFSLSTKTMRTAALLEDNLEKAKQTFVDAVLASVEERLRAFDQRFERLEAVENHNAHKFACSFGLFDSTSTALLDANVSACTKFAKQTSRNGSLVFTSSGKFIVPIGVSRVRVLLVGGGAGGGSGYWGGGGSGFVLVGEAAVEQFERVPITVGRGGQGSAYRLNDATQTAAAGERSAFGQYLIVNGGVAPTSNWCGGDGGSGGGASSSLSGTSGPGGADGSGGTNSWQTGGSGQGTYKNKLRQFKLNSFTAGTGGSGGSITYGQVGGGGGGGVLMNGAGPAGANGQFARGGAGYGAGGGGGHFLGNHWFAGGNGADGLVYVEW